MWYLLFSQVFRINESQNRMWVALSSCGNVFYLEHLLEIQAALNGGSKTHEAQMSSARKIL